MALILKRASASRTSGEWNDDDFDVLAEVIVGRIFLTPAAPQDRPWMWASGHKRSDTACGARLQANTRGGDGGVHRRALELLAASADGATEAIMLAHGFSIEQMVELVRAGLATARAERVVSGTV
jgi:hypothetical protein